MQAICQALEGAADQAEDYWKNRIQPFWQQVWPKSRDLATPSIAESLTRMVIAARGEFPAALAAVKDWLQAIQHPDYVIHQLHDSGLCKQFPSEALQLLSAVITNQRCSPQKLGQCLDEIIKTAPKLEEDAKYLRLREYFHRYG